MGNLINSIEIENVVASSDIGQELDLDVLSENLSSTEYNPENFPGVVYRIDDPEVAALIFNSGKLVCTGANSVQAVETGIERVFSGLSELGISVNDSPPVSIQNVVSSADLDRELNLNAIAIGLGLENVEYEPEQFPGLVYRINEPDVVALLFGSGKLVITGGQSENAAEQALKVIQDRLMTLNL